MREDVKALALSTHQTVLTDGRMVLKLFEDEGAEDGAYFPPKSFSIVGRENIEALRDFLNEHFPERSEKTSGHQNA
jgi:hypothetical protein